MPLHRLRDLEADMFPDPFGKPNAPQPSPRTFQIIPLPGQLPPAALEAIKALYEQAFAAAQADARAAQRLDRLRPHWN